MANLLDKLSQNIAGRFYVDSSCVDCDVCREHAPAHFRRDDEIGQSYVFCQPETPEEIALCREAVEGCPTESIGED
jgi:ferredoxin